jgi:hypothetical protein
MYLSFVLDKVAFRKKTHLVTILSNVLPLTVISSSKFKCFKAFLATALDLSFTVELSYDTSSSHTCNAPAGKSWKPLSCVLAINPNVSGHNS